MTLIEKQKVFSFKLAELILEARNLGWEITMGECWRPHETAEIYARDGKGIQNSAHCIRLACDLNLFKNGLLVTDSFGHEPLGDWWKAQSTEELTFIWGGDFRPNPDGNHYAISHGGVK